MSRRRHPRSRSLPGGGSLRILPIFVAALAVIAGMLVMADHARREADRARQAQAVMEHTRTLGAGIDSLTWRRLAGGRSEGTDAVVSEGLGQYKLLTATLRDLRALGVPGSRTAAVERRLGEAYGQGMRALLASRRNPVLGGRIAKDGFAPAMRRFDVAIAGLAAQQERIARGAQQRTWLGWLGSLTIGLLLLCLLGWRMHRIQRRSAVAEQARDAERRSEERLAALVRHSSDVVAVVDGTSQVRWVAESVRGALGYDPADVVGARFTDHVHADDAVSAARFLEKSALRLGRAGSLSVRLRCADGDYRAVEVIAHNHIGDPLIDGILLNFRDVSERVALEEQLRHQAFHDDLTGLANRALFEDRLTLALARGRRHDGRLAVIFVDLDDFKTVNDSLGHAVGDELLRTTAQRLAACLRAQDTAARVGGDEFAILLEDLTSADEAWEIAERLRRALEPPVVLDGRRIAASASLGVECPGPHATADDVLGNADLAMYAAKDAGKGRAARFEPAMRAQLLERVELGTELGLALERDELFLEYQPLVELDTERITGVEALVRWQHPTRGRLGPDRFIALAESNGAIVEIGRWVLETACAQLRRWHDAGSDLQMSVNVSTRQLADPDLPRHVRAAVDAAGIDPTRLTLEITEHLLLDDGELMQRRLQALKEIGVHLAIDDFGTGYSALSYLQTFPIDVLKIDRSFVSGIDRDPERARLVRSIVEMGHTLRLSVVSEGIEQAGEAALMREFRSHYGQGYLFSKPVDPTTLNHLLAHDKTKMEPA
jgi:diguanylate cyclase (GGDEF)-like protein/PAS domain S-box-containing protein